MKKSLFAALIVLMGAFQSATADKDTEFLGLIDTLRAGEAAPEISFLDGDGSPRTLADYAGKALVVNFWATWCAPCIAEMPALDALNRRFIEAEADAMVLTINTDFDPAQGPAWLTENQIQTLPALYDSTGNAFFDAGGKGMPHTLVIAPDGAIAFEIHGDAPWDANAAFETVVGL